MQYIWFGTRQQLDKLDLVALSLEFPTFVFSTSVRDLGVILDQELSFVQHITALTRSCFYHLRQLRLVSRSLSASSTATLVHCYEYSLPPCYITPSAVPIYQTGCCPVYYTCDLSRLTDFAGCRLIAQLRH